MNPIGNFNSALGRATWGARKTGVLPDEAKSISGITGIDTSALEPQKKKKVVANPNAGGTTLMTGM
jgi:hypothetical protein